MGKSAVASISLPDEIAKEVERVAKNEHKTKSGVIADAVRQYLETRKWHELQQKMSGRARKLKIYSEDEVEKIVDEVRL